ncbi:thioesterase domain-containing protein [Streptomyces flavidovirens]|uniref:thioesterase domain-containing protein n=1 Tax=Streptomyces flavidovirens TaxID=67298 RepID=UPI0034136F29
MELGLFVLHHAGGSPLPYRDWASRFPADRDVRLMEAPGRGLPASAARAGRP